jgi:hypothetical protein
MLLIETEIVLFNLQFVVEEVNNDHNSDELKREREREVKNAFAVYKSWPSIRDRTS